MCGWILFEQFCVFLDFGPYVYTYLQLGPYEEKLADTPDNQRIQEYSPNARKIQKDVPDDQKPLETPRDYDDYSVHAYL